MEICCILLRVRTWPGFERYNIELLARACSHAPCARIMRARLGYARLDVPNTRIFWTPLGDLWYFLEAYR